MFNNKLIEKLAKNSNPDEYTLSSIDSEEVLNANRNYKGEYEDSLDSLKEKQLIPSLFKVPEVTGKILDLSCGNGFLLRSFLKHNNCNYYCGVDISLNQLEAFKKINANLKIKSEVICSSVTNIPLPDESFDIVMGHSFLHHIHDVPKCLQESFRLLKTEGVFILMHEPSTTAPFFESFPVGLFKDPRTPSLEDVWLFKVSDIKDLLKKSGFTEIEVHCKGMILDLLSGIHRLYLYLFNKSNKLSSPAFYKTIEKLDRGIGKLLPRPI